MSKTIITWRDAYRFPVYYDKESQKIFDQDANVMLDIRGWDHLTGQSGLKLSEKFAIKIQDQFGYDVAKAINENKSL